MIIVIVVGIVAAFFLMKRKGGYSAGIPGARDKPNCNASTQWCTCPGGDSFRMGPHEGCDKCTSRCGELDGVDYATPFAAGFDPVGGGTGARPFDDQANLVQGTLQFPLSDKVAIPIISGSVDFQDPTIFDEFAHGMCQCDSDLCCYHGPYQPRRGDIETEQECEPVEYGDQVRACDDAFALFQDNLAASGIDNNDYIRNKITDRHFFFKTDDGMHGKNRHRGSDFYDNSAYLAYANVGGKSLRTPGYKAFSGLMTNTNTARAKTATRNILRTNVTAKDLRNRRLRRKLR